MTQTRNYSSTDIVIGFKSPIDEIGFQAIKQYLELEYRRQHNSSEADISIDNLPESISSECFTISPAEPELWKELVEKHPDVKYVEYNYHCYLLKN